MQFASAPFERRVVVSLALLYAFRMLGLFMVLPVLALYGSDYAHASPLLLGLALGAYGFSQGLLQIPFGILSDRIGRKPVIIAGLLVFTIGSVVAAQAEDAYTLILGRLLQGGGAIAGAVMALLADLTAEENRTKAMAVVGASIGASFSLALVLGPLLASWGGMAAIFWLTAGLGLVGIYIVWQIVPTATRAPTPRQDVGTVPALVRQVVRNRELLRLNLGIFVLHLVLMAAFLVLPPWLAEDLAIARDWHWAVYLPLLIGAFVAMLPFIIIAERRRQMKPVFLGAIALLLFVLVVMAVSPVQRAWTLGLFFLFFMAFNLLEASLPSMVSKIAPAGGKGTATSIYASCQFFGAFAGGALGGALWQWGGPSWVLGVCAAAVLLWLLLALPMRPPRYLASVIIPLAGPVSAELAGTLQAQPGVADVLVVESEGSIYLKVDPKVADRQRLIEIAEQDTIPA
ncbi:MFS transporter [Marinimicrobium alkaliphilum]|uniref:MFS transporter n=1 Tax=Marinimicrobium alkaliphilum TaxID=2202654 RepID=UPI000DBA052C|nr:MFS transporter [Marinimicrobium alkaliphilum]